MNSIAKISASRLSAPTHVFRMRFLRSGYRNVIWHPEHYRLVDVLADSPEGAMEVLLYHYSYASEISFEPDAELADLAAA